MKRYGGPLVLLAVGVLALAGLVQFRWTEFGSEWPGLMFLLGSVGVGGLCGSVLWALWTMLEADS